MLKAHPRSFYQKTCEQSLRSSPQKYCAVIKSCNGVAHQSHRNEKGAPLGWPWSALFFFLIKLFFFQKNKQPNQNHPKMKMENL